MDRTSLKQKLLSILLCAVMTFNLGTVAYATEPMRENTQEEASQSESVVEEQQDIAPEVEEQESASESSGEEVSSTPETEGTESDGEEGTIGESGGQEDRLDGSSDVDGEISEDFPDIDLADSEENEPDGQIETELTEKEIVELEKQGFSTEEIEEIKLIKSAYSIGTSDAATILVYYHSSTMAIDAINELSPLWEANLEFSSQQEILEYVKDGYDAVSICEAALVAEILKKPFGQLILSGSEGRLTSAERKDNRVFAALIQSYPSTTISVSPETLHEYFYVNVNSVVDEIRASSNHELSSMEINHRLISLVNDAITLEREIFESGAVEQNYEQTYGTQVSNSEFVNIGENVQEEDFNSELIDEASLLGVSGDEEIGMEKGVDVYAPYTVEAGKNESVSMATGAFQYTHNIVNFPATNSESALSLNLIYDSDEAAKYIEFTDKQTEEMYLLRCRIDYYTDASCDSKIRTGPLINIYFSAKKDRDNIKEELDKKYERTFYWLEDQDEWYSLYPQLTKDVNKTVNINVLRGEDRPRFIESINHLGPGWAWDIPAIDYNRGGDDTPFDGGFILYIPGKGKYHCDYPEGNSKTEICKIRNYDRKDIEVKRNEDYYTITFPDGVEYGLDRSSRLAKYKKDRYGNQTTYTYNSDKQLTAVQDCYGRTVSIAYNTENNQVIVTSASIGENPIVLQLDDGKLQKVTDSAGRETTFSYEESQMPFNFFREYCDEDLLDHIVRGDMSLNQDIGWPENNTIVKLTGITHPSGAHTSYTYSARKERLNEGSIMHYKLASRQEEMDGQVYNRKEYDFSKSYSDYGNYETNDDFTYIAQYSDLLDSQIVRSYSYKFNYKHLPEEESFISGRDVYNSRTDYTITRTFDSYDYPSSETKKTKHYYQFFSTTESTGEVTTIWRWTHDIKGNLLSEINPKAEGSTTATYKTTYDYTNSPYGIPVEKVYKQDANTTIKEVNVLDSTKKFVIRTEVYSRTENPPGDYVLQSKTEYTYNSNGNVTEKREYPDIASATCITTKYAYNVDTTDGNGVTDAGAYLVKETVTGVKDADETLIGGDGIVSTSYAYDAMGNLISTTDPNGHTTNATYDSVRRVLTKTDGESAQQSYAYNDATNVMTFTDKNGTVYQYEYDVLGNLLCTKNMTEDGRVMVRYTYDKLCRRITEDRDIEKFQRFNDDATIDFIDDVDIIYRYDCLDRLIDTINHGYGIFLGRKDDRSTGIHYRYMDVCSDGKTRIDRIESPYQQDSDGVYQLWNTTAHSISTYNKYGELTAENSTLPYDIAEDNCYLYNYIGQRVEEQRKINNALTTVKEYEYDYAGRVIKETDAYGGEATTEYDDMGRAIRETDKKGKTTVNTYDSLGRLIIQERPFEGNKKSYQYTYYDKAGNVIKTKQTNQEDYSNTPRYAVTEYEYDGNNHLTDVIVTVSGTDKQYTHYELDAAGNTVAVYTGLTQPYTEALSTTAYSVTEYEYDSENRVVKTTYPDNTKETVIYPYPGAQKKVTDRNGKVTTYEYNTRGQMKSQKAESKTKSYNNTASVVTRILDDSTGKSAETVYKYDHKNQLTKETTGNEVKTYTYDDFGNRLSYTLKIGEEVVASQTYAYDRLDRLIEVKEGDEVIAAYTYDANGNRASLTQGGVTTTYTYNDANLVTSLTNKKGTDILSSYSYTYYLDGNQRTKTDVVNNRTTTYGYDLAGRLTSESESGGNTYAYTYDSRNNRASLTVSGDESYNVAYEYDGDNRLLTETKTIDGRQEITNYSYDNNGNQILKTQSVLEAAGSGAAGASLQVSASEPVEFDATVSEYDVWNRQVKVTNDAGTSSYAYYPDGLRYSKTVNGALLRQVWDGTNLAYEYTLDEEDAVVPVRRYARGINAIYVESGGAKSYYLYNAHGDVVQLTDATGTVTQEYEYDAFGNEQNPSANDMNPLRYCGEYFDAETGTIYLRARYYDPGIGRFTSADSFLGNANDPLSLNRYTYCHNNPILYLDYNGEEAILASIFLGGLAAIFSGAGIYAAQNAPSQSYVGKSLYDRQIEFEMKMMTGFVVGMMQAGASVGEYTGAAFDAISRARTEAGRDLCIDDAMARTRNSEDPVVLFRFNTPT
ncbi:RHS repeat-associated core domain-containing protein, partial [Ligaoa zhengdingensis]